MSMLVAMVTSTFQLIIYNLVDCKGRKQLGEDSDKPEKQQQHPTLPYYGTDSVTSRVVKQKDLSVKLLWKMSISNQTWQPLWEVNELSGVTKCNLLGSQFLWRYDECAWARGEYWSPLLISENVGVGGAVALPVRLKRGEGERPQYGEGLL